MVVQRRRRVLPYLCALIMRPANKRRNTDDSVSLNKYISDTGFCSRREADDYIAQGRVTINDEIALSGNRVVNGDVVEIDGEPIRKKNKTVYLAFHKPVGVTSTTDPKDKTNIIDFINFKFRIFPIGRLDKDSEGLIFLTNDGNIVNKILRAENNNEKEYVVTVDQPLTPDFLQQMSEGVRILRTRTKPCKVNQENKYVFRITLTQGMNRQIRRMCDALGYKVKKLVRVRIMNVHLGKLPSGHWRFLTAEEVETISRMTDVVSAPALRPKKSVHSSGKSKTTASEKSTDISPQMYLQTEKPKKPKTFKDFRKAGKKK